MLNTDLCKAGSRYCPFRVTDFYFSYISFHVFSVVFLRNDMIMMFLLNTYTRLCFFFQNTENNVKNGTCIYFSCHFLGKDTTLGNLVMIQVQYN